MPTHIRIDADLLIILRRYHPGVPDLAQRPSVDRLDRELATAFQYAFAAHATAADVARACQRSVDWVYRQCRRLGLPAKTTGDRRRAHRARKHPITIAGDTRPLAEWVHYFFDIPAGQTTRVLSVVMLRYYRHGAGPHLWQPITGVAWKHTPSLN